VAIFMAIWVAIYLAILNRTCKLPAISWRVMIQVLPGSDYFNYKGYYSLVLMAVVGPNSELIFADVVCQSRISDGGVLRNTVFYKALQSNNAQCYHIILLGTMHLA
jgi:hypothetical protein